MKIYQKHNRRKTALLLFFIFFSSFFVLSCGNEGSEDRQKPSAESAPDFTLENLGGNPVSLHDLKGNPVFINFWASWCKPCREEMPHIEKIHSVYEKRGLKVLAINSREAIDVVEEFRQGADMSFPVLIDKSGDVTKLYRVFGLPVSYFIDRDGKVAASVMGKMTYEDMDYHVKKIL